MCLSPFPPLFSYIFLSYLVFDCVSLITIPDIWLAPLTFCQCKRLSLPGLGHVRCQFGYSPHIAKKGKAKSKKQKPPQGVVERLTYFSNEQLEVIPRMTWIYYYYYLIIFSIQLRFYLFPI